MAAKIFSGFSENLPYYFCLPNYISTSKGPPPRWPHVTRKWRVLTSFGEFCQVLASFDKLWRVSASFGEFWRVLASFGEFWRVLASFGEFVT